MFKKSFYRKGLQVFHLFIDLISAFGAVWISLLVRSLKIPSFSDYIDLSIKFLPVIFFGICFMYLVGLYVVFKPIENRQLFLKFGILIIAGWFFGFVYFYLFVDKLLFPKTILLLFWIFFTLFTFLSRKIIDILLLNIKPVILIFIGQSNSYQNLITDLNNNKKFRYIPKFIYKTNKDKEELEKLLLENNKDRLLIVYKHIPHIFDDIKDILYQLISNGYQFIEYSSFYEYVERKIPPEDIGETWFIKNSILTHRRIYFFIKRIFDILSAIIGLILSLWAWPVISLIIHLDSPGPVFFKQLREGRKRKTFELIKFRTMTVQNNNGAATVINDSRITKAGRFLRKTRLDELPQLINVLKGDMSLIGPRPERPEFTSQLEKNIPWYNHRLFLRPGITGWDQVCGEYHSPSQQDSYKKLQNDLYYIKNCSLFLDISIIFKTIMTVLKREGA